MPFRHAFYRLFLILFYMKQRIMEAGKLPAVLKYIFYLHMVSFGPFGYE